VAVRGEQRLRNALAALRAALAEVSSAYMVIGGLAVILRGIVRQTNDVDATVWAADVEIDALFRTLARHGIVGRISDAAQFARANPVPLARHTKSRTPMDISLAWLPFQRSALERAERIKIAGVSVPVARAEDLVVYKAIA
jgi:hypothetical protein